MGGQRGEGEQGEQGRGGYGGQAELLRPGASCVLHVRVHMHVPSRPGMHAPKWQGSPSGRTLVQARRPRAWC